MINDLSLLLVHPPRDGDEHELERDPGLSASLQLIILISTHSVGGGHLNQIDFLDGTRSAAPACKPARELPGQ
jgi:hypothetical protein